jgi:hypothetical protein
MQCWVCACSLATLDTTVRQLKSIIDPQPKVGDFANANFPVDLEGRTLHLGCKVGQPGRYAVLQEATWYSHAMTNMHHASSCSAAASTQRATCVTSHLQPF